MMEWLEKHMVVTLLLVIWMFGVLTAVTIKVFWFPPTVPGSTAAAYATLFGALAVVVGLWQFRTRVIDARKGIIHDFTEVTNDRWKRNDRWSSHNND
jgi:uncharacterized membrane protein YqjE